jgi:PDZ domain
MNSLIRRLMLLGFASVCLSRFGNFGVAQNQPVAASTTQPTNAATQSTALPTTVNPNILPLHPPQFQQAPINQPTAGIPTSSSNAATTNAATTFQSPRLPADGTPTGSVPVGRSAQSVNQQNISQPGQQAGRTPISPGTLLQPQFVPTFVSPVLPFDATNPALTIANLDPSNFYYQSGLRPGDVILSSYGIPIQTEAQFQQLVSQHPSQPMPLVVRRNGIEQRLEILPQHSPARLGVRFDMGIPNAAVVTSVTPGSPAELAGLRPEDMITALNGQRISSYQHAMQILAAMQPGDRVDIRFTRSVENATRVILDGRPASVRTEQTAASPESNARPLPK